MVNVISETMYQIILSCVMVLAIMQSCQAEPDMEVCTPGPGDAKGQTLPTLPDHFKITVEALIRNRNYSTSTYEIYDNTANRGAIHSQSQRFGATKTYYDYDDSQYYIVFENNTCVTRNLTDRTFAAFGYHTQDGKAHVNSAKDIFKFGEHFNETYMGETMVNDMTVDWWSACMYDAHSNHTYTLDFYFTVDHPEIPSLPVRMVINGTGPQYGPMPHPPGKRWFYHIYKFHGLSTDKQPESEFLPPLGVVCPGRVSHKAVPKIPDHFQVQTEMVSHGSYHKSMHYIQESYNFASRLVAYESVPHYFDTNVQAPVREVHDYNTGISYQINTMTEACKITPIPTDAKDALSVDGEHVTMRKPLNFFGLHADDVDWVYVGLHSYRSIDAHVWITKRDNWTHSTWHGHTGVTMNSTWQYYFANDDWTSDNAPKGSNIPLGLIIDWNVRSSISGRLYNGTDYHTFFHYTSQSDVSQFDVSQCYAKMNESLHLAFNLEGKDTYKKYIANNTHAFYHGATASIAKSMGVSSTRIANIHVVEGYRKLSTVFFTLLDKPSVVGDSLNATDPGPSLDRAYKTLQLLVNSKEGSMLVVEFIYFDEIEHINGAVNSLREETSPLMVDTPLGLGTGAVAGIAIGTFILGAAVAFLISVIAYKKTNTAVPYGVQE